MLYRLRSSLVALSIAGLAAGSVLAAAQDKPKPDDAMPPAVAKTAAPYRRVPSNFGKVGLSNQQREDIYVIRGRYRTEIAELEQRINALSKQEMEECRSVLTDAQLKLLDQISNLGGGTTAGANAP